MIAEGPPMEPETKPIPGMLVVFLFGETGKACGACHEKYRAKQQ